MIVSLEFYMVGPYVLEIRMRLESSWSMSSEL